MTWNKCAKGQELGIPVVVWILLQLAPKIETSGPESWGLRLLRVKTSAPNKKNWYPDVLGTCTYIHHMNDKIISMILSPNLRSLGVVLRDTACRHRHFGPARTTELLQSLTFLCCSNGLRGFSVPQVFHIRYICNIWIRQLRGWSSRSCASAHRWFIWYFFCRCWSLRSLVFDFIKLLLSMLMFTCKDIGCSWDIWFLTSMCKRIFISRIEFLKLIVYWPFLVSWTSEFSSQDSHSVWHS